MSNEDQIPFKCHLCGKRSFKQSDFPGNISVDDGKDIFLWRDACVKCVSEINAFIFKKWGRKMRLPLACVQKQSQETIVENAVA